MMNNCGIFHKKLSQF